MEGGVNYMKKANPNYPGDVHLTPNTPNYMSHHHASRSPVRDNGKLPYLQNSSPRARIPARISLTGTSDNPAASVRSGSPLPYIGDKPFPRPANTESTDRTLAGHSHRRNPSKLKSLHYVPSSQSVANMDDRPNLFNPDPMPFHAQVFKSSNVMKRMTAPHRGELYDHKGYLYQTNKHQLDGAAHSMDGFSQRDRITMEMAYTDKIRHVKNRRYLGVNRHLDFLMLGGQKVPMYERDDIMAEIKGLKGVILPQKAKDLYVGKGFKLPSHHTLNKPKAYKPKDHVLPLGRQVLPSPASAVKTPLTGGPYSRVEATMDMELFDMERGTSVIAVNNIAGRPVHNPLEISNAKDSISDTELHSMEEAFKTITKDAQGNFCFSEVKRRLNKMEGMTAMQERYISQLFNTCIENHIFGLDEFISLNLLCKAISSLRGLPADAFDRLDVVSLPGYVTKYVELFDEADSNHNGEIPLGALQTMFPSGSLDIHQLNGNNNAEQKDTLGKLPFLAHLPYLMDSCTT